MNIDQITNELKNLSDKMNLIDNNVKFNIQIFWGVLSLIAAVLGIAIYFLVKQFINHTIEKELDKKLEILKQSIIKEITYENQKNQPTLINGWRSKEGYERITYWKDREGYVHLQGVISDGVMINHTVICSLPQGYIPNEDMLILVKTFSGVGKCRVSTKGLITIDEIMDNKYIEFNSKFKGIN